MEAKKGKHCKMSYVAPSLLAKFAIEKVNPRLKAYGAKHLRKKKQQGDVEAALAEVNSRFASLCQLLPSYFR